MGNKFVFEINHSGKSQNEFSDPILQREKNAKEEKVQEMMKNEVIKMKNFDSENTRKKISKEKNYKPKKPLIIGNLLFFNTKKDLLEIYP